MARLGAGDRSDLPLIGSVESQRHLRPETDPEVVPGWHPGRVGATQVWTRTLEGQQHRVEATGSWRRTLTWSVDGETVVEKRSSEEKVRLDGGERGTVLVVHSLLGTPQRATLMRDQVRLTGGTDLTPEAGSRAEAHERAVLEHPTRYSILHGLGGVGTVVVPIVLLWLIAKLAPLIPWPSIDLPDLPSPNIDLPSIPWPDLDLPSIPWPDITLPEWLAWILDKSEYVVPIVIAVVLARAEIKRRRRHAAERAQESAEKDD